MVVGLSVFAQAFAADSDHYVLIGGAAVQLHLEQAGLHSRVTKDLDLVCTAQVLNRGFAQRLWAFLIAGGYERWERGEGEPVRYRFRNPTQAEYPAMLEFLGRPLGEPPEGHTIVPMPTGDDMSDLSVILLDDDIFQVVRTQRQVVEGVSCLKPFGLILLKARAYLDLKERRDAGERVHSSEIKKHRNDVFRMAALLASGHDYGAPASTVRDLARFLDGVEAEENTHRQILASLDGIPGGDMRERIQGLRTAALG